MRPIKTQEVNINQESAKCLSCGADLVDIANIEYQGKAETAPTHRKELCKCRSCGQLFSLRYDLFDAEGHIYSRVFVEDVNNPNFHWQDLLTDEQKEKIAEHLDGCTTCTKRLNHEILSDAWLKSFMGQLKKHIEK
jgi:transcription elongation factor Elf1